MKQFQLRAWEYECMIEWIPYDRLVNKKKIGKGGFDSVYSATWLDGIRKVEQIKIDARDNNRDDDEGDHSDDDGDDDSNYSYKRSREPNSTVALKTLSGSLKEVS